MRKLAAALAIVAAALLIGWFSGGKYFFIAKRWGVVVPNEVYRSGQISRWVQASQWEKHRLGAIIDLNGIEPESVDQRHEIELAASKGLIHERYPLSGDGTGDIARYADAIASLDKHRAAGVPVLVHCAAGAQRTGGVVACYRVLMQGWSTDNAVAEMQSYGFRPHRDLDLLPYLDEHIARLAALLKERGLISEIPDPLPKFTR